MQLQCRLPIDLVATEPAQAELLIAEQSSTHSLIAKQRTILPELQHTVLLNTAEEMKKSRGLPNASECPLADTTSAHSKGHPPRLNKKASKVGTGADDSLLTDQADDASDFLNWKELNPRCP